METEPRSAALSVVCCSFGVTDLFWVITAGCVSSASVVCKGLMKGRD